MLFHERNDILNIKDFNKEQLSQIKKAKNHGLSNKKIMLFMNPNFDSYTMKLIRKALENCF